MYLLKSQDLEILYSIIWNFGISLKYNLFAISLWMIFTHLKLFLIVNNLMYLILFFSFLQHPRGYRTL